MPASVQDALQALGEKELSIRDLTRQILTLQQENSLLKERVEKMNEELEAWTKSADT